MNFRTNQVLQFYVNNNKNVVNLVDKTEENGTFWFTNTQGGKVVSRTDVVDADKILYVTAKKGESERRYLKAYNVSAPTEIVAGQDYVVKVEFTNYQGMGDMDRTVKVGAAHATANTDAKKLMDEIAWTLEKNLKSEYAPLVTVTVDGLNNIVIAEERQDEWVLGVTPDEGVNFRVYIAPIIVDGEEVNNWATVSETLAGGAFVKNGRKMADLEYFAMGERGDQYRMVGWPNVIRTKYLIDPTKEYDSITIHYAFVDSNEGVQKSERDLMIVGEANTLSDLYEDIADLNITIKGDIL